MVNSICILRLSAIGDVTHALPVVATLQNRFPDAKITWVIGKIEYKLMYICHKIYQKIIV